MDGSPAPPKRFKSSAQDEETPHPVYAFCLLNEELFDQEKSPLYEQLMELGDAKTLYGIKNGGMNGGIPIYREDDYEVDRDDADSHML